MYYGILAPTFFSPTINALAFDSTNGKLYMSTASYSSSSPSDVVVADVSLLSTSSLPGASSLLSSTRASYGINCRSGVCYIVVTAASNTGTSASTSIYSSTTGGKVAESVTTSLTNTVIYGISSDSAGNLYIVGPVSGTGSWCYKITCTSPSSCSSIACYPSSFTSSVTPYAVTVDSSNNLYVTACNFNPNPNVVYKISNPGASGNVATVSVTLSGYPSAIAVDTSGALYIADSQLNPAIMQSQVSSTGGVIKKFAGSTTTTIATGTTFSALITGLAIDTTNNLLYVADYMVIA